MNRLPIASHHNKTPYELLFAKVPVYSNMKSFGCLAFVSNLIAHMIKFDPKLKKCIFIRYPVRVKGYRLYDSNSTLFLYQGMFFSMKKCFLFIRIQ